MKTQIQKFLREEDGITALEYGILASIVVAAIVLVFGTSLQKLYNDVFTDLGKAVGNATGTPSS